MVRFAETREKEGDANEGRLRMFFLEHTNEDSGVLGAASRCGEKNYSSFGLSGAEVMEGTSSRQGPAAPHDDHLRVCGNIVC